MGVGSCSNNNYHSQIIYLDLIKKLISIYGPLFWNNENKNKFLGNLKKIEIRISSSILNLFPNHPTWHVGSRSTTFLDLFFISYLTYPLLSFLILSIPLTKEWWNVIGMGGVVLVEGGGCLTVYSPVAKMSVLLQLLKFWSVLKVISLALYP